MTVTLPDGRALTVPDDLDDVQRGMLKAKLRMKYGEPATASAAPSEPAPDESGGLGDAAGYLGQRVKDVGGAAWRLLGPRSPLPDPDIWRNPEGYLAKQPTAGQMIGDVATVAGAAVAPGLTALGALGGAAAKGFGASDQDAAVVDAATSLVGGVGRGVVTGTRRALASRPGQWAGGLGMQATQGGGGVLPNLQEALKYGGGGVALTRFMAGDILGGITALGTTAVGRHVLQNPHLYAEGIRGAAGPTARGLAAAGGRLAAELGPESLRNVPPGMAPEDPNAPKPTLTPAATPSWLGDPFGIDARTQGVLREEARQDASPPAGRSIPQEMAWASSKTGVPMTLLKTVMRKESAGNPKARSPKGALGLMQLLPSTFDGLRPKIEAITGEPADISRTRDNILAGALYFREALDKQGGKVAAAARYYHGGPDVRIHGPKTNAYGVDILSSYQQAAR